MKKFILAVLLALPMTMFAQKIGHVDIDAVAQGMPEFAAMQTELQTLEKQFQDEGTRKQNEFKTKLDAYNKEKDTLSETLRTYREQELQKASEELEQFAQTSQQEYQRVGAAKQNAMLEKIMKAVEEVGAAGGYAYILPSNAVAYIGSAANNVTDQVKAKVGSK